MQTYVHVGTGTGNAGQACRIGGMYPGKHWLWKGNRSYGEQAIP